MIVVVIAIVIVIGRAKRTKADHDHDHDHDHDATYYSLFSKQPPISLGRTRGAHRGSIPQSGITFPIPPDRRYNKAPVDKDGFSYAGFSSD